MKRKSVQILVLRFAVSVCLTACSSKQNEPTHGSQDVQDQQGRLPDYAFVTDLAGAASSDDSSSSLSFNVPAPNLSEAELALHLAGDIEFNRQFTGEQGLGPAFNANSCIACHARDGRGALPIIELGKERIRFGPNESLLLRVGLEVEGTNKSELDLVPGFTEQLHHRGIYSLRQDHPGLGQTDIEMSFEFSRFAYPDGSIVELRKPIFSFLNPYDETTEKPSALRDPRIRISPRIGPPVIGLGLLDAIDDKTLIAMSDPDDKDGDGISGRVNLINGQVGRYGWKANTVTVRDQVAQALNHDMGLTTSLLPVENIFGTALLSDWMTRLLKNPSELTAEPRFEVAETQFDSLSFYTATLAVPKRRNATSPDTLAGAKQFEVVGCTGCHTPMIKTGHAGRIEIFKQQTIYPFSDGLLHDMGEELSDGRPDYEASGREWRTRPLWGIGLTQTINPRAGFLHDGRARTLEEAILFHGGEAASSRAKFANLPKSKRQQLISFLRSL